jgi:hypothetical protein
MNVCIQERIPDLARRLIEMTLRDAALPTQVPQDFLQLV